jgi:hypothetical protein
LVRAAVSGLVSAGRWFVASMMCALVAHAALYASLAPGDGLHSYFAWYEPLVTVASVCSLLAIVASGVFARRRVSRLIGVLLPARATRFQSRTVAGLAVGALAFLMAQESLERSVDAGAFTLATFGVATWPVLVAALGLSAAAVLAIGRTAVVLSEPPVRERPSGRRRVGILLGPGRSLVPAAKTALLGRHAGLRAPPLVG